MITSSFSCTIFSDMVCCLLSNVCVVTSFYQSLQAMSSFVRFSICATYCTLSVLKTGERETHRGQPWQATSCRPICLDTQCPACTQDRLPWLGLQAVKTPSTSCESCQALSALFPIAGARAANRSPAFLCVEFRICSGAMVIVCPFHRHMLHPRSFYSSGLYSNMSPG